VYTACERRPSLKKDVMAPFAFCSGPTMGRLSRWVAGTSQRERARGVSGEARARR
jgi:hypothetical protein